MQAVRRCRKADYAERDALVEQHIDWARSVARRMARRLPTWFTVDDLSGAAMIALIQTAAEYDPNTGVPFRAYAISRVRGACIDAIRRKEYLERKHAELTEAEDCQTQPETPELCTANVWRHVWKLPPQQFRVIQSVYVQGETLEVVAKRMGIHPSRASQHHTAALRALRASIESTPRRLEPKRKCRPLRPPILAS